MHFRVIPMEFAEKEETQIFVGYIYMDFEDILVNLMYHFLNVLFFCFHVTLYFPSLK